MTRAFVAILDTSRLTAATILAFGLLMVGVSISATAQQDDGVLSVPATFDRSLRLPGHGDHIRRPLAIFEDRVHGEIVVADAGRNRLVFFDSAGTYRFEFDCADRIGAPIGVAIDSQGFVYVLGTSTRGRVVLRYDFDGFFLSEVPLDGFESAQIEALTIDSQDRLVLLDQRGVVHVVHRSGELSSTIKLLEALQADSPEGIALGQPVVDGERLLVPASTLGTVLVFDLNTGAQEKSIGFAGNTAGQLNFPIAVDVLPSGVVAVLDKMRFAVVCYAPDGRFLGEFGGKGFRDGWFYHPTLMVATETNKVIVGQILESRIQMLELPAFVMSRLLQNPTSRRGEDVGDRAEAREVADDKTVLHNP